jgi:hypothetical protein
MRNRSLVDRDAHKAIETECCSEDDQGQQYEGGSRAGTLVSGYQDEAKLVSLS